MPQFGITPSNGANMTQALPVVVKLSPNILFQELDDEAVLLNLDNEHYYGLDDIGARLWQLLEAHGNTNEVIAQVLTEYDVDEATLNRDLAVLLSEFEAAGLVTLSAP